jgi:hypothetical protein
MEKTMEKPNISSNVTVPEDVLKASAIILSGMIQSERFSSWHWDMMIDKAVKLAKDLSRQLGDGKLQTK